MTVRRPSRLLPLLLAAALVVGAAACGSDASVPTTGSDGSTTTTTDPGVGDDPTTTSPGDDVPDIDPGQDPASLPADQVVWQVASGGGFVPYQSVAAEVPELTIYGDGRAFVAAPDDDRRYDHPIAIEVGEVSDADLLALVDAAGASGLFTGDVDLGSPDVTDLGDTSVTFQGLGGEPVTVSAYAFLEQFDDDLTDAQAARRRELRTLLSQAGDAVADTEPWTPDRIRVTQLNLGQSEDPAEPWPGPALATFVTAAPPGVGSAGCGELAGEDAATVFAAAVAAPGIRWTTDAGDVDLVVAALLPGQEACSAV